jgi:hypothetical protein
MDDRSSSPEIYIAVTGCYSSPTLLHLDRMNRPFSLLHRA